MNSRVLQSSALYVAVITLFIVTKPLLVCTEDGKFKPFGLQREETLLTAPMIAISIALLGYGVMLIQAK